MVFSISNYIYLDVLVIFLFQIDHFTFFRILSIFRHFFDKKSEFLNRLEAMEVIFNFSRFEHIKLYRFK